MKLITGCDGIPVVDRRVDVHNYSYEDVGMLRLRLDEERGLLLGLAEIVVAGVIIDARKLSAADVSARCSAAAGESEGTHGRIRPLDGWRCCGQQYFVNLTGELPVWMLKLNMVRTSGMSDFLLAREKHGTVKNEQDLCLGVKWLGLNELLLDGPVSSSGRHQALAMVDRRDRLHTRSLAI
ncbi:hypothetical protein NL676_036928 [Syzygium grande]|nr:hypothetical protein NL676_036928 [Syzygium grande]